MKEKLTLKQKKKLEKRELKKKDKEWSIKVRERDGNKCFVCGSTERIQAHHIIPREIKFLRWDLENGIALCSNHHKFSLEESPHKNPLIFYDRMRKQRPKQIKLLLSLYYLEKYGREKYEKSKGGKD